MVARKVDNAIQRISHYPADSVVCFVNTQTAIYPVDRVVHLNFRTTRSQGPFLQGPEKFPHSECWSKVLNLIQRGFIHVSLTSAETPFIQEVSGVYSYLFVDTD